jgi:hypothetical protein
MVEVMTILAASAAIVLLSAMVPLYFIIKVKYNRRVLLSSITLIAVLVSYASHAILESVWQDYYELIRICFIVSMSGTILTYFLFNKKQTILPVTGVYGISLFLVFVIWVGSETIKLFIPAYAVIATYFVSIAMIGFGISLVTRFFWLRNQFPTLTHGS